VTGSRMVRLLCLRMPGTPPRPATELKREQGCDSPLQLQVNLNNLLTFLTQGSLLGRMVRLKLRQSSDMCYPVCSRLMIGRFITLSLHAPLYAASSEGSLRVWAAMDEAGATFGCQLRSTEVDAQSNFCGRGAWVFIVRIQRPMSSFGGPFHVAAPAQCKMPAVSQHVRQRTWGSAPPVWAGVDTLAVFSLVGGLAVVGDPLHIL
jgi:hypothetical protein